MKEDLKIDIFDFKQRAAKWTFLKDKITNLFNCFTVREMIDTKTYLNTSSSTGNPFSNYYIASLPLRNLLKMGTLRTRTRRNLKRHRK